MTLNEVLQTYFGHSTFRPHQEEAVRNLLGGKDQLVVLPTGGGKSLCYQLPAILMEGCAIVVSPLISLMKDQLTALERKGIPAATLNSSITAEYRAWVIRAVQHNSLKLLYLSPETLLSPTGMELLKHARISFFAIDEAHCISRWGYDFRPEYAQLNVLKEYFPSIPVLALTATADAATRHDIISRLALISPVQLIGSFDRPNIYPEIRRGRKKKEKIAEIVQYIKSKDSHEVGIIYCTKRSDTEALSELLNAKGIRALPYHAAMSAHDRAIVHDTFISGKVTAICATLAFGMGIDKQDVRWVIHFNMPMNIESYYQEIGRAGRDGLPAEALLYYNVSDLFILKHMISDSTTQQLELLKMEYMRYYCETDVCRRRALLNYFGVQLNHDCGHCDSCRQHHDMVQGTIPAQMLMSTIARSSEQANIDDALNILRGYKTAKLSTRGWDRLTTFGIGRSTSFFAWRSYCYQLIMLGCLSIDYSRGGVLLITSMGYEVLYGRQPIELLPYTDAHHHCGIRR